MKVLFIFVILVILFFGFYYTGREYYERYTQKMLRDMATRIIPKLNEHKINYWVDYGTLLGIVREGDIIKHDNDIDICIIPEKELGSKLEKIVDELDEKYKGIYYLEYHPWGAYRIRTKVFPSLFSDLYLIQEDEKNYIDPTGKLPKELAGNFTYMNWKDIKVRVPEKVHETLVWRYGENYMTPLRGKKQEHFLKFW